MAGVGGPSGVSVLEALHKKYSSDEPLQFDIHVPKSAPGKKEDGQLVLPRQLVLNTCGVECAGDVTELSALCSDITELDVADNRLTSWTEVLTILGCFPGVHFVNLSDNVLGDDENGSLVTAHLLTSITRLILNNTHLTWLTLSHLLPLTPSLIELHLSLNDLSQVVTLSQEVTFPGVKELYVNKAGISSWLVLASIVKLFPGVENLVMVDNPMEGFPESQENLQEVFPALRTLNLSGASVRRWEDVEPLRYIPNLTHLRMLNLPLLEGYEQKLRRQLILGYFPGLSRLNGSTVSADERDTAERAFIRHYQTQEQPPHRYTELVAVHGHLDPLVNVSLRAKSTVSVVVYFNGKSHIHDLDLRWTVAEFKKHMSQHIKVAPSKQQVYHKDPTIQCGLDELRAPRRQLLNINVRDGDELHIFTKDS